MYKSLAAALLVAATEAATTTYKHDYSMAVPTAEGPFKGVGTAVTGAVDGNSVTKSDCKISFTNTAKSTVVTVTQTTTAKKMTKQTDVFEAGCSWKESSAIYWTVIGQYKGSAADPPVKFTGHVLLKKLTAEPTATNIATSFPAAKLLSDGLTAKADLAAANATTLSPDLTKATNSAEGSTKITTATLTLASETAFSAIVA